ncbi:MAG TPA: hypothetical protein PLH72_04535 [Vicinamibacterales bacterium]|nr:hypothetical protein [Vicinamibacterales bacterium]
MRRAAVFGPLSACLITGAALYVSRGVLDAFVSDGRAVRLALLPPWESLLGFVVLGGVGLLLLDRFSRQGDGSHPPLWSLVQPAVALSVLLLPFLPVLPDRWPVLQTLAGPMSALVWLAVGSLLMWVWWQHHVVSAPWLTRRTIAEWTVMVGLATALVSGAAAARLTGTVLFPAGDEPHYLVIAQSLWRDGDFKIENNHQRGDYREYFGQDLEPHYLTRGADEEIYSIHPVGLPILLAPVYGLGGYLGVILALIAMASVASALMWRWVATTLHDPAAATFAWAVIVLSAPFLLNTFTVYPEIAAALAVMVALTTRNPWVAGVACGLLPWLGTKYAPMSAVLLVTSPDVLRWPVRAALPALARRSTPYAALLVLWFSFFYAIWGSPWPQAPYGAMVQTTPWNLVFGAPGLLFDQEYGLLPYAPAYILAATGLWALWRMGGDRRWLALRVVLVFGALLGTVGAFRIWWGGAAAPARPLASGLLVLGLPIAAAFAAAPQRSARRAAQHLLLWIGAGIAATLAVAQEGLLIANGRDGTSSLLEWWSPRWELWTLAPTFIYHEAPTALAHAVAWLAIAAVAATVLARIRARHAATAAWAACAVLGVALASASVIIPWLPADPPLPRVNLLARSRLTALDAYDTRARPAAVVYDPLRKTTAVDMLPALTLGVTPGLRPDPQPLRVLHNGRFSLPAGEFRVDVTLVPGLPAAGGSIALQVGRTGPPLRAWPVAPGQTRLSERFGLPVDAGFVGFRGSREMEQAIASIVLTPLAVVDQGLRVTTPQVLASAQYGHTLFLMHDDQVNPEPTGFWILGQRATRLSVALTGAEGRPTLRLRSAAGDNAVTLRTHGWEQVVTLASDDSQEVELPSPEHGIVSLTIQTSRGFVPMDHDPASRDRRYLGVWVDVP